MGPARRERRSGSGTPEEPVKYAAERTQQKRAHRNRYSRPVAAALVAVALVGATIPAESFAAPVKRASKSQKSGDALEEATARLRTLQGDPKRQRYRHHWLPVIDALEEAGRREKNGPRAALAYMRAGLATRDLAAISHLKSDYERAESYLARVASCCSRESLADDALLAAARLNMEVLGRPEVARKQLERAVALKGDMRAPASSLLSSLPPPPKPRPVASSGDLDSATRSWNALQADAKRRVYRDPWLEVITSLEAAAGEEGCRGKAALALMRAGRASEDLARISGNPDDARRAEDAYVRVANRCPDASLADDALLSAAIVAEERLRDPHAARNHLGRAIALAGDMAPAARARLKDLPADAPAPRAIDEERVVIARAESAPNQNRNAPADHATEEEARALEELVPEAAARLRAAVEDFDAPSLSEQVGLKIRRIVIDAGHGGHDSGAIGPTGLKEKDVTLAMSRRLSSLLQARGYETVLTRDSDEYLELAERSSIANREKGDLFISVHANAHTKRNKSGVETYYLNVASDRFAMRLAARENASTERSISDLELLLADLATRANTVDSARLARSIQDSVVTHVNQKHGNVRDLGVKHALFYVLLGARMPAVLVETAFISNPTEEKRLGSAAYQDTVAVAIADGIESFIARRVQLASADH